MSRMRTTGASKRSRSKLRSASAACWLFCCMSPFLADALFEESARLMHRVLAAEKLVGVSIEVLRRRLNRPTHPNDRNQCIEGFLIERLMRLRCGHDQLQSEAVVELNDLVDVVGIKFLERLIHQQKSRLRRRIPG